MELADTIHLFMNSAEATLQRSCWALRLTGMLYGTSSNLSLIVRCRPKAAVDLPCLSRREAVVAEVAKPPKLLRFAKVSKATMPSPSQT
jgi:hypothetical protein